MEGGASHKNPGGARMLYDVTTLTVRPGTTPKALPQLDQWLHGTGLGGTLLACWLTEIGALNQILLIREYGSEPAIAADRDAIVRSGNPYGLADMITAASCDAYVSFPFLSPMQAGSAGPIFEVRTYVLKPGGLGRTIELWRAAVQNRVRLSPLLAAMYSLSGGVPRFMHIWPYASLDERQRIRDEAVKIGVWPPPGGPDHLLAQQADIFLPAPFSPIR
jgi:NIPSNAP